MDKYAWEVRRGDIIKHKGKYKFVEAFSYLSRQKVANTFLPKRMFKPTNGEIVIFHFSDGDYKKLRSDNLVHVYSA